MRLRSMSAAGRASRKFSRGTRLWPPASSLASPSYRTSSAMASSSVAGAWYSNFGGFMVTSAASPVRAAGGLHETRVAALRDLAWQSLPGAARGLRVANHLPQVARRHREFGDAEAERAEGIADRVGDDGGHRHRRRLAETLGAE